MADLLLCPPCLCETMLLREPRAEGAGTSASHLRVLVSRQQGFAEHSEELYTRCAPERMEMTLVEARQPGVRGVPDVALSVAGVTRRLFDALLVAIASWHTCRCRASEAQAPAKEAYSLNFEARASAAYARAHARARGGARHRA